MKPKLLYVILFLCGCLLLSLGLSYPRPPVQKSHLNLKLVGEVELFEPLWGARYLTIVFANTQQFPADHLGQTLAENASKVVVIDVQPFLKSLSTDTEHCLSDKALSHAITELSSQFPQQKLIVAGIAEAAMLPLLYAQIHPQTDVSNISIGFSLKFSPTVHLCSAQRDSADNLQPRLASPWHVAWADQPDPQTGVFVRKLNNTTTRIAAYDTPLEQLLVSEISALTKPVTLSAPPLPVVESKTSKPNPTLTLFYSGDGGWRDLDRSVAEMMVNQQYPVIGVDVLRYFWETKSPEQAAADLAATMAYYRQQWGSVSFVLAGYSFGADILPALYNRLSKQDQDSVKLLVLLALGEKADFEIHVSGWLGKASTGLALAPELDKLPKAKIFCVYGEEERNETACRHITDSPAQLLELPGGHHFDQDYHKLTEKILDAYILHDLGH